MSKKIIGKKGNKIGIAPAIILLNPKYPRNVGNVRRVASCYGISQVWYTGTRVRLDSTNGDRLPREERMKCYNDVQTINYNYPLNQFEGVIPVAVEIVENAECLINFEHPPNAVYMFGPEDGGIKQVWRRHAHRFVFIPTRHCLNLATAVTTVIYDRFAKEHAGEVLRLEDVLHEERGFIETENLFTMV